ncbi:hypothetical protein LCGC14_1539380 [marine sediment metagenome]|uniref:Uncharacterized protein n=1 Tax=marine sediment metagenome TaxID=412755 RepID=A0A0F9L9Q2_9ZZZZ
MITIPIKDSDKVLSDEEAVDLASFAVSSCRTTSEDRSWIKEIVLRNDGRTSYYGYWEVAYLPRTLRGRRIQSKIVLNTFYLLTMDQLKKTLAHEMGHNWTTGYLISRLGRSPNESPPRVFYAMRGLDTKYASKGVAWQCLDREVMAEDYRTLCTSSRGDHRMANDIGLPSAEVKDYFIRMGYPRYM